MRGLCDLKIEWTIFTPNCDPFAELKQILQGVTIVPTASRGVFLASDTQDPSVVFVPNRQLPTVLNALSQFETTRTHPLVLIVEDHPGIAPHIQTRSFLSDAGITSLEPSNAMESEFIGFSAGKLAAVTKKPIAIIAHHGLLGASASAVESAADETVTTRIHGETDDAIRLSRRLELNRQRTLPSPGERGSVGFITVGLADSSLRYLVSKLGLLGRVPTLNIRLVTPLDAVPIKRLLTRCHNLVVLEPRPGEVETKVMDIAEQMRRDGEEVALVWGKELPPVDPEDIPITVPVDAIHPSVVARMIKHLLHDTRPSSGVESQLLTPRPPLQVRPSRRPRLGTAAALQVLSDAAKSSASTFLDYTFTVDGSLLHKADGKTVSIETWGSSRFYTDGLAIAQSLAGRSETRVFLVWDGGGQSSSSAFLDASFLPATKDDKSRVVRVPIDHAEELNVAISEAIERDGATIIVVKEGDKPRFDIDMLSEVCKTIDARGFLETNVVTIAMSEMSDVHFHRLRTHATSKTVMPLETKIWSDWLPNEKSRFHLSLRPVIEQATVVRVKPPIRVISHTEARLTPPSPIHANASEWRAHIAGTRGGTPGVVAQVLLGAAGLMGYETRSHSNSVFVGAGRQAWTQILFTRPQTFRTERPLTGFIPWGEADLMLGWDREEVMRAVDPAAILQIGSAQRTYAIINTGKLDQQLGITKNSSDDVFVLEDIRTNFKKEKGMVGDFSAWARYRFHNTRLGDIVQLGVAFQQGLVPVTVDAIHSSLQIAEDSGFARSRESFDYGRRIALHPDAAWVPVDEEATVDLTRLKRRYIRNIRGVGFRGKKRALIAQKLFDRVLKELPGLSESNDGREALYAAIVGVRRCMLWGGEQTATTYVDLIKRIYQSDRVETGRGLTRCIILTLAEAMLVRDPIYLSRLARSPEIIRNLRHRLNVRKPRGDELHRRFLSQFELSIGKWRLRADIRTSDWSSALLSNIGRLVPKRFRGRSRDRKVRAILMDAVQHASKDQSLNEMWLARFKILYAMAIDGTLHSETAEKLESIIAGTFQD